MDEFEYRSRKLKYTTSRGRVVLRRNTNRHISKEKASILSPPLSSM